MVGSLIQSVPEAMPLQLEGEFGIDLGLDVDTEEHAGTNKYHLYARKDVATALHSWMLRRHGAARVDFEDVFVAPVKPTEEFPDSAYMARLSSGQDMVKALMFPRAVEGSENAAAVLLGQMSRIAEKVAPEVIAGSGLKRMLESKRDYIIAEHPTKKPSAYNFAGLHNPDQQTKADWLKSHISPRSLTFWLNRAVFVDLALYGGAISDRYRSADWQNT